MQYEQYWGVPSSHSRTRAELRKYSILACYACHIVESVWAPGAELIKSRLLADLVIIGRG
jgi:hypothetical protein